MSNFSEPRSDNEILTLPTAYKLIWSVGNMFLGDKQVSETKRAIISAEIGNLFARLDSAQADRLTADVDPKSSQLPDIRLGTLLAQNTAEIDQADSEYHDNGRNNAFLNHDERLDALKHIDLFARAAAGPALSDLE